MEYIELIIYGVSMCVAFFLGAYVKTQKEIKVVNPITTIKETIDKQYSKREAEKEQEIYKTIAENIDRYDGTSRGQKEIPR